MKRIYLLSLSLFFTLSSVVLQGQTAAEIVKKVDKALMQNYPNYQELEAQLQEAKILDPKDLDVDYLMAILLLEQSGNTRALEYVKRIQESGEEYGRDFDFYRAYLEHRLGNFDNAIKFYQLFKTKITNTEVKICQVLSLTNYLIINIKLSYPSSLVDFVDLGKIVDNRISQCESAKIIMRQPKKVLLKNVGDSINTNYDEYSPVYSAIDTTLYFTSRRPIPNHLKKDQGDELFLEHIFESKAKFGTWSKSIYEDEPLNTFTHNVSALAINKDGNDIYIFDHRQHGDIMHSKRLKSGNWSSPIPISSVFNTNKQERSFAISDDGNLIIIERDGLLPYDRDLYYSTLEGNEWSVPKNIGNVINTEFQEDGVFLHNNGKELYFSSKGHNSIGGYDVFKSVWQDSTWGTPVNLGYPINSVYDDVYFIISDDERFGFVSSDRPGGSGGFDIYYIDMKPIPLEQQIVVRVIDKENGSKIKNASVVLIDEENGAEYQMKEMPDGSYETTAPNKADHQKFKITIKKTGYGNAEKSFFVADSLLNFDAGNISIKQIKPEIIEFVFNDVYLFDVNSSKFFEKYHQRLDVLINALKDNNVVIKLEGHTDSSGGSANNQKLSERRAESVKEYLVSKGVNPKQIVTIGFGEDKPLNDNSTKELKELNRRVVVSLIN